MRKTVTLLLLSVFVIASCKKEQQDVTSQISANTDTPEVSLPEDQAYFLSGIYNRTTTPLSRQSIDFVVNKNQSAIANNVKLSFETDAPNVTGSFTEDSDYPPYQSFLNLNFNFTPSGIYTVNIISTSEGFAPKEHPFTVIVEQDTSANYCQSKFFSSFDTDHSTISSDNGIHIVKNPLKKEMWIPYYIMFFGRVTLYNSNTEQYISTRNYHNAVLNTEAHMRFSFDCTTGDIEIPEQGVLGTINGAPRSISDTDTFTVSGSGKVDPMTKQYTITYKSSFVDNGITKTTNYTIKGDFNY